MIAVALVAWYVVEYTPLGRKIDATGGNEPAARLAGIRTRWTWGWPGSSAAGRRSPRSGASS